MVVIVLAMDSLLVLFATALVGMLMTPGEVLAVDVGAERISHRRPCKTGQ